MARVRRNVVVGEQNFWGLFDSGARNTYVVEEVAALLPVFELDRPEAVALAGRVHEVRRVCLLSCLVEGLPVRVQARALSEIGQDDRGRRIEVLIGALAMEEWGITPVPSEERVDMTHYPREFVEFVDDLVHGYHGG